jgi:hypothetical protein
MSFVLKKNEQFKPIKWKNILRKYRNKKDDDDKQRHITTFSSVIQKLNKQKELQKHNGNVVKKKL